MNNVLTKQQYEEHEHSADFVCVRCTSSTLPKKPDDKSEITQQELQELLNTSAKLLRQSNIGGSGQKDLAFDSSTGGKVTIKSKFHADSEGEVYQQVRQGDKIYKMGPDGQLQLNERIVAYNLYHESEFRPDSSHHVYVPKHQTDFRQEHSHGSTNEFNKSQTQTSYFESRQNQGFIKTQLQKQNQFSGVDQNQNKYQELVQLQPQIQGQTQWLPQENIQKQEPNQSQISGRFDNKIEIGRYSDLSSASRKDNIDAKVQVKVERSPAEIPVGPDPNLLAELERLKLESAQIKDETMAIQSALKADLGTYQENSELKSKLERQADELHHMQTTIKMLMQKNALSQASLSSSLDSKIHSLEKDIEQSRRQIEGFKSSSKNDEQIKRLENETQQGLSYLNDAILDIKQRLDSTTQGAPEIKIIQIPTPQTTQQPDISRNIQALSSELLRLKTDLERQQNVSVFLSHNHPIEVITTEIRQKTVDKSATQSRNSSLYGLGSEFQGFGSHRNLSQIIPSHVFTESKGQKPGLNSILISSTGVQAPTQEEETHQTQIIQLESVEKFTKFDNSFWRQKRLADLAEQN